MKLTYKKGQRVYFSCAREKHHGVIQNISHRWQQYYILATDGQLYSIGQDQIIKE